MRRPVSAAILLALGLTLTLAACSDDDTTTNGSTTDDSTTNGTNGDGGDPGAVADFTEEFSIAGGLGQLPVPEPENYVIQMGDLETFSELSGTSRPADVSGVSTWVEALQAEHGAVVPFPMSVGGPEAHDFGSFEEEAGWSVADVATYAEVHGGGHRFTLMTGEFSPDLVAGLPEVAEGVHTLGEGEDGVPVEGEASAGRPYGFPVRMLAEDGVLVSSHSTDDVTAWSAGSADTLADDADFAAVAEALDADGVFMATLAEGQPLEPIGPANISDEELAALAEERRAITQPFTAVGFGLSEEDGSLVITLAYAFPTPEAAEQATEELELMFTEGSWVTGPAARPFASDVTFRDVVAEDTLTTVHLAADGPGWRRLHLGLASGSRDLPTAYLE